MKKLVICTLALMLMASSIFATETRVLTMGDNNMILIDDANVNLFPGRIYEYPNLAIGEFGRYGDDFTSFGITWQFNKDNPWVLGTFFSTAPPVQPNDLNGGNLFTFDDFGLMQNRRINLLYGRMLGGHKFGFNFDYIRSGTKDDYTDQATEESFGFYDFRFGLTEAGGQWDVALWFGLGTWTDKNAAGEDETETDGYMDIALAGRYFYVGSPTHTWVPHIAFMYNKHGVKDNLAGGDTDATTLDLTETNNLFAIDLGVGLNYVPATNVLAVIDVGLQYSAWKQEMEPATGDVTEDKENTLTIPYWKIGLDADVFSWMDVRFGATSDWHIFTEEFTTAGDTDFKRSMKYADNETYLGFGFHWGRLHVDTYTDPEIFLEGFNFISGGSEDMNFQISALYEMF